MLTYHAASMRWLANGAYLIAGLLYLPVALYNAVVVGKNRSGWGQRFGFVTAYPPGRPRIWIHAVSLGETNATTRIVAELEKRLPEVKVVFSATTDTGYARAVQLYGADRVFRFPLDFSPVVGRVLRRVNPSLIVLVELEVWYNLVTMAAARNLPVAIINGRLTQRSARRFDLLGGAARRMFGALTWVGAQDETIAERFRKLGVKPDRVEVTSSLKWDSAQVTDHVDGSEAAAYALGIDRTRPVWVCGSTGPGEEAIILNAYRRIIEQPHQVAQGLPEDHQDIHDVGDAQLVIVPRKPERFDEVARLIEREGFCCTRRSIHSDDHPAQRVSAPTVFLGDTMGELRKFYLLARVVFVGRSLVAMGGSDPMEVAALGKPIVVGPHMSNFADPTEALARAGALETVEGPAALAEAVARLLAAPETAAARGEAGRRAVLAHQGATEKTADKLTALLTHQNA